MITNVVRPTRKIELPKFGIELSSEFLFCVFEGELILKLPASFADRRGTLEALLVRKFMDDQNRFGFYGPFA